MRSSVFNQPRIVGKYFHRFRYFLLSISLMLFILLSQTAVGNVFAQTVNPQTHQQHQAALLTQKGHKQLNQGQAEAALQTWQSATKIYQKLQTIEGVTGSLINQSLAFQALGMYPRACNTLLEALNLHAEVCDPTLAQSPESITEFLAAIEKFSSTPVNLSGLQSLGDVLRVIGKLEESELILQQTLLLAKRLTPKPDISTVLLSLGNTQRARYEQLRGRYSEIEKPSLKKRNAKQIQQKAFLSLDSYQQLNDEPSTSKPLQLQSRINSLGLMLSFEKWLASEIKLGKTDLETTRGKIQQQIQLLVSLVRQESSVFSQLPASQSVQARLNFANSLTQLPDKELQQVAIQYAEDALQTAQSLDDKRLKSYSLGALGNLHKQTQQLSQPYFEEALRLALGVQAWDIAYQWQQQLGRLYHKQGNYDKAVQAYDAAIHSLDQVRGNLSSTNSDVQFSFKEQVEPVYREYMRLLLTAPNPNLEQVIQTNEQLQLAELENFLQCGKLDFGSLSDIQKSTAVPTTVYLINLENQIQVIVRSPQQSLHHYSLNIELAKDSFKNLLKILQDERFNEIKESQLLPYSQAVYKLLIAPIKKHLPPSGTLVFVLDSYFQSLPLSILHDGENYLLKTYNISIALSSQLRQPQLLKKGQLKALVAGISKQSPSFNSANAPINLAPLPEVEMEIADIQENIASSLELLNEEFTSVRLQQEVDTGTFPVLHITTHGQFSSDPEQTVILAWNKAINVRELNSLLRSRQGQQDGIELLVLSACQTAKGNKRSTLGLAGVAAQAGARSTIATLWLVDAQSTAQVMGKFYKGLSNGVSKAEALRQAQLSLLSHPKFKHPYYWSTFVLVGSWL